MRVVQPTSDDAVERWWLSAQSPDYQMEVVRKLIEQLENGDWQFRDYLGVYQTVHGHVRVFPLDEDGLVAHVEFLLDGDDEVAEVKQVYVDHDLARDPFDPLQERWPAHAPVTARPFAHRRAATRSSG